MDDYNKTLNLVKDQVITDGLQLPKIHLHKWLVLGQTDYLCEYGTLSDGHEKLTDAQKYAQALKELYGLSQSIKSHEILAKKAQADLLEAEDKLKESLTIPQQLRAEADLDSAKLRLSTELVSMQDQMRMAQFYHRKIKQLQPIVEAKYPNGIEQAEQDNWTAVYEYRMLKERVPGVGRERTDNIPLSTETKAKLGYEHGRFDSIAPLAIENPKAVAQIEQKFEYDKTRKSS